MKKPLALTDNELAQEYAATYARLAAQFVDLFERIEAVDKEISRINGLAPSGEHRRLRQVELVARGLDNFSRADPPITKAVQLPDRTNSEKMVWPPPQPSLAAVLAMSMVPSRPTLHGRSSRWSATAIATPRNAQGALDAGNLAKIDQPVQPAIFSLAIAAISVGDPRPRVFRACRRSQFPEIL